MRQTIAGISAALELARLGQEVARLVGEGHPRHVMAFPGNETHLVLAPAGSDRTGDLLEDPGSTAVRLGDRPVLLDVPGDPLGSDRFHAITVLALARRGPALEAAIRDHGGPGILNTDQGSQFTSMAFIGTVQDHGIQLSMDGRGAWRDNLFVERLWKSVKYEEVYLHAYDSVAEAHQGLARYFTFYNSGRPHAALDGRTPDMVYFGLPLQREAA